MSTIANLAVQLSMDAANFDRGVGSALSSAQSLSDRLAGVGRTMSMAVTAPLLGAAGAAIKFSTDFNAGMANTQSLGVTAERIAELKGNLQTMAVDVGKNTADLADGLYQVVSAFGDTADTADILEINARAAAAGLATTTDAINLTSAVTKGFGDTSAAAVQHTSDLAFQTVKLGQTTFPELAASMGRVVPIAASLGVKQEELFGVMATATGVTGSAAEVSTQLRGVLQSLMAPTDSMNELIASLGYETGAAMLQQEGLQGAIEQIVAAAEASGAPLQSYLGSIEGQTLALALAGPQADVFTEKLAAMQDVAGASDAAFRAQTQGINASGFTMQQLAVKSEVLMQKLGDGLAPALAIVLDAVTPLVDWVGSLATSFAGLDSNTQLMIVAGAGLVAALGPLLTMLPMVTAAVGLLASPVGLVIGAVALLGAAWATNFGGIQDMTMAAWAAIQPTLAGWVTWAQSTLPAAFAWLGAWASATWTAISGAITQASAAAAPAFTSLTTATGGLAAAWASLQPVLSTIGAVMAPAFERLGAAVAGLPGKLAELAPNFAGLGEAFGGLLTAIQPLVAVLGAGLVLAANLGVNLLAAAFERLPAILGPIIDQIANTINLISTAITGVITIITALATGDWSAAWTAIQDVVTGVVDFLTTSWNNFTTLLGGFGAITAAVTGTLTDMGVDVQKVMNDIAAWWSAAWEGLKSGMQPMLDGITAVNDAVAGLKAGIEGFKDWITGISIPNPFAGITLPAIPEWMGGAPGNAAGTPYWRGGLTWVGEEGPELINLPRGTQVIPNDLSMDMAGAGAGGMHITVNATVSNKMDLHQLAYDLATEFDRWRQ